MKEYSNINIRFNNCQFYINEEKRKTTCVIRLSEYALEDFLDNMLNNEHYLINLAAFKKEYISTMPTVYVGVATCAPEDKWNEEYGKQMAFYKAKKCLFSTFFRHINKCFNFIDKKMNEAEARCDAIGAIWANNLTYLRDSLKQENVTD